MRITGPAAPTNPFHLSRAYGVARPQAMPSQAAVAPASPAAAPGGRVEDAAGVRKLVAAVVPGGVAFDGASARPSTAAGAGAGGAGGAYQMYSRPADRNAAATGVWVGRVIDVNG